VIPITALREHRRAGVGAAGVDPEAPPTCTARERAPGGGAINFVAQKRFGGSGRVPRPLPALVGGGPDRARFGLPE